MSFDQPRELTANKIRIASVDLNANLLWAELEGKCFFFSFIHLQLKILC